VVLTPSPPSMAVVIRAKAFIPSKDTLSLFYRSMNFLQTVRKKLAQNPNCRRGGTFLPQKGSDPFYNRKGSDPFPKQIN
jgi:hypothetical protein